MEIIVDLKNFEYKKTILAEIGHALYFGKNWGANWDALNDALRYLDQDGIWGDCHIFKFPLKIIFNNYQEFQKKDPKNYKILNEILDSTEKFYSDCNKNFSYTFK